MHKNKTASPTISGARLPLPHSAPSPAPIVNSPNAYHPGIAQALAAIIRERGVSDSGAARHLGISASSLSQWKREHEILGILLAQAREEFREAQLDIILAAGASGGRSGWRAAAWLLERVFPEDYSPRAAERARFQKLAASETDATSATSAVASHNCQDPSAAHGSASARETPNFAPEAPAIAAATPAPKSSSGNAPSGVAAPKCQNTTEVPVRSCTNRAADFCSSLSTEQPAPSIFSRKAAVCILEGRIAAGELAA